MKVAILNVTGYAGGEVARILARHPHVRIASVTGRSEAGKPLGEVFPHLGEIGLTIEKEVTASVDLVFSALPQRASAEACLPFLKAGVRVIDLSPDFRLKAEEYREWYGAPHPCPEYLEEAVYGLTELHRQEIASARLVANPGCYATAAVLALAPAVKEGLITGDIVIDAKSGVSGAGRSLSLFTHFAEVNENVMAYSVEGHRHLPEIVREVERLAPAGFTPRVTFLTHLIPMTRGILCSCYAPLRPGALPATPKGIADLQALYRDFYRGEPFVKVVDTPPMTKHTLGNNHCILFPTLDRRTGRLLVISVLDNLVKGAAGQGVQNMNRMLGLPEGEGLGQLALYP